MKNLILITIGLLVSIVTFSQEITSLEKLLLQKVNEYRLLEGFDTLTFSPIAYKVGKDISEGNYDEVNLNLDNILVIPYGVEGTQIGVISKKYSESDGSERSEENIAKSIIKFWTDDIEDAAYLVTHYDIGNGNLYSGAVSIIEKGDTYRCTLVIHERI